VGEISIPIVETLPTTEPPKCILMAIHCAAAEHGGLINNKERKKERKESSWVKLTTVERPNESIFDVSTVPLIR